MESWFHTNGRQTYASSWNQTWANQSLRNIYDPRYEMALIGRIRMPKQHGYYRVKYERNA